MSQKKLSATGSFLAAVVVILLLFLPMISYLILPAHGVTWSTGQSLTPTVFFEAKPYVMEDSQGVLWAVYESYRSSTWDIYGRRFEGSIWLPEERFTNHTSSDLNPAIAQLANGTILLVWSSDRSGEFSLYYKTFTSGAWSYENRLTFGPGKDSTPALLQARNGTLWLFWTRETVQGQVVNRDVIYKTYTSGGWSPELPLANSADLEWQPSIFQAHNGTVWAVYSSRKPGNYDLFYRTLRGTWSPEVALTSNADDDRQPWITQDNNGTIWTFWTRCVTSGSTCQDDIFYKTSTSLGGSWSPEVQFTVDPQGVDVFDTEPAAVHARNRRVFLLWTTSAPGDGGNFDIFYSNSDPILFHDVSVSPPSMAQYKPRRGERFNTTVRVQNVGDYPDNANLSVTIDGSVIGSSGALLQPGQWATFSYSWDTTGKNIGLHDLQASLATLQGEARTWNNQVSRKFYVLSAGDVHRDGPVNILDLAGVGRSVGLKSGDPAFNPDIDLNHDGRIDVVDLTIVGLSFGQDVVLPPDFDLASNIYYIRLVRGSSTMVTVTAVSLNGLHSPVTLTATTTGLGVTATFSPNVIIPSATSNLTLTASPTAAAGNFTIKVLGTNQTITKSITLFLTVTSSEFNLSASPPSLAVALGSSGNVTITITSVGAFSQPVTLTTMGLPAGVTGTFSANPVTPPSGGIATSTLSLNAATTASTGTFTIAITGTSSDGTMTKTTTFSLDVTRRTSYTTVTCTPATIVVNQQTTCTVTVSDTSPGTVSTPTGSVAPSSSGTGSFIPASCPLAGSGASASCQVVYTPTVPGVATHTITATYGGDLTHGGSSGTFGVTVNKRSTTAAVACVPTSVAVNQAANCTATVNDTSPGTILTPTGSVSFTSSGTGTFSVPSCTLSGSGASASCQVTYTPSSVGTGSHAITGAYAGDLSHNTSSGAFNLAVVGRATATTVACTPATVVINQNTVCTITVTDTSPGTSVTPTGLVTLTSSGTGTFTPASCNLSGSGGTATCQAAYTPAALGTGTHTLTGSYPGDPAHNGSSGTFNLIVSRRTTSTSLSCTPAAVVLNQATACTVTVTDTSPGTVITPTGTVSLTSSGTGTFSSISCTLAGAGPSASCTVSYTPSTVGTGTHTITGTYNGDAGHNTSMGTFAMAISKRSTSSAIACAPSPAILNNPSTCTVTVTDNSTGTAITPTGSVTLATTGSGTFTPSSTCTLSGTGASASCTVIYTPTAGAGSHAITSNYSGDAAHNGSSGSVGLLVNKRSAMTSVTCTPSPVVINQQTSCTATVTDTSAGTAITPTGSVAFTSSGTGTFSAPSCIVSGSGTTATCQLNYTPTAVGSGTHTITGSYNGDGNHDTSQASTVVVVGKRNTATTINCAPASTDLNQQTSCAATVTDTSPGTPITPAGMVTFTSSGTGTFSSITCAIVGVGSSASCTVSYTPTATGTHTISVAYPGDSNHNSSGGVFNLVLFNFSLSVTPGTGTLFAGGNMSAVATATLVSGDTRLVSFSASGLPPGVSIVFTPSSCSPGCSSRVNFTATSTATIGNFTITIAGTTGGGLTQTADFTLTLLPKPEFTISVSPSSLKIYREGSSGTVSVTVTYLGLVGDVNKDGTVNILDLSSVAIVFGTVSGGPGYDPDADVNGDGVINIQDLTIVSLNFGRSTVVTLSATGLPSGVTASFSPGTLSPGGTSTLSLAASATATTGDFTITVTGSSASASQSTMFQLTVKPAQDFSITPDPASLTVRRGRSGTVTVAIASISDFQSPVTLSITGLPSGVTASFTPNPATPPANGSVTSTLTLTASNNASLGTFTLTVTGTSGGLVHTTTITLTVSR